jgi:hypothetical protein
MKIVLPSPFCKEAILLYIHTAFLFTRTFL